MQQAKSASARYVWIVVCAGLPLLAHSVWSLVQDPPGVYLFVLLGLTVAGAGARLRIPAMPISFSIADTFSIATALLVGTPGGTIAAALDGLVLVLWLPEFFLLVPGGGLLGTPVPPRALVGPLVLFTRSASS